MFRIGKITESETSAVVRSWGRGKWGVTAYGYGILQGNDKNVLELVVMAAQPSKYTKLTELNTLKR